MKSPTRPATRNPGRQSGITLVEVCVVLAVSVVLASTAAPSLRRLIDTRLLDRAATTLASDLQFVRTEAVARNQALRLSVHTITDGSCYVIHTGTAAQCTCNPTGPAQCSAGAQEVRTVVLLASDRVRVEANVHSVLFDPLHGTSSPTGTLRLIGTDARAVHHIINIMGRVRSCSPQGAIPGYRGC